VSAAGAAPLPPTARQVTAAACSSGCPTPSYGPRPPSRRWRSGPCMAGEPPGLCRRGHSERFGPGGYRRLPGPGGSSEHAGVSGRLSQPPAHAEFPDARRGFFLPDSVHTPIVGRYATPAPRYRLSLGAMGVRAEAGEKLPYRLFSLAPRSDARRRAVRPDDVPGIRRFSGYSL